MLVLAANIGKSTADRNITTISDRRRPQVSATTPEMGWPINVTAGRILARVPI
jgi:hypothetical protein